MNELWQVALASPPYSQLTYGSPAWFPALEPGWRVLVPVRRSLRVGVAALRRDIQAAFIVLADQPGLTVDLLRSLLARYHATNARIIAPFYEGRRGNPVLFDRALFVHLQAVDGDKGARELLALHEDWVEPVDVDSPAVLLDVDTPHDYRRLGIEEP
ncbi:MAG: nucleotidyltransferase family protein [Anaerolineae bacterium]